MKYLDWNGNIPVESFPVHLSCLSFSLTSFLVSTFGLFGISLVLGIFDFDVVTLLTFLSLLTKFNEILMSIIYVYVIQKI